MKNTLKRPLPSTGKPNKYSSAGKKRALNVRPPKPASVSRLESILDGTAKNKKKKKKTETEKENHKINKTGIDGTIKEAQTNPNKARMTSKGGIAKSSASTSRRRVSDENSRNQARGGNDPDRWLHVNSKSKSNRRGKAVNPFLAAQTTKIKTDVAKFVKASKTSDGSFLSQAKKDRTKKKTKTNKSTQRKEFCIEEKRIIGANVNKDPTPETTIISREAIKGPTLVNRSDPNDSYNNSKKTNFRFENDNCITHKNDLPPQPAWSSQEETVSNDCGNEPTISDQSRLLPQQESNHKGTYLDVFQTPSIDNKNLDVVPESSFRPKLGLRLGNKETMKGKIGLASMSRFRSSRRVTSSPNHFQRTLPVTDAEDESPEGDRLIVLRSPGKSGSSLPLPQDSFNNNGDNFLASDTGAASDSRSSPKNSTTIDDEIKQGASTGLTNTIARTSVTTNRKTKITRKKNNINDNFVRLNMKNNAGACRGAKNKSSKYSKERRTWTFRGGAVNDGGSSSSDHAAMGSFANPTLTLDPVMPPTSSSFSNHNNMQSNEGGERRGGKFSRSKAFNNIKSNATSYVSKMSGLDPLDEFVDGTFHASEAKKGKTKTKQLSRSSSAASSTTKTVYGVAMTAVAPMCARHQRPCKLIKVKKATTGNKGREFYACSMPRGEQCDHFQWADDTVEVCYHLTHWYMSTKFNFERSLIYSLKTIVFIVFFSSPGTVGPLYHCQQLLLFEFHHPAGRGVC